jgi:hypothetical protein
MKPETLRLKRSFSRVPLFTALLLALLFVALELFLRATPVQPYLVGLNPSLGGRHLQMEEQLAHLERYANRVGHVDCIFLGSSLVWMGINPAAFEDAFFARTGETIHCYNLGVVTLPANAASALAEVITTKYHPWLLLYGTSARDYAISQETEDNQAIMDTPWLRYELGDRTPWTWLVSNSFSLRYMRDLVGLARFDEKTWTDFRNDEDVTRGFEPRQATAHEEHVRAAALDAANWLQPFEILQTNLDGLDHIVKSEQSGNQVVVIEMPVSEAYVAYFTQGQADYDRFITEVSAVLAAKEVPFIRARPGLILDEGWWDRSHMNEIGAKIFSEWLAGKIVELVETGVLEPHEPGGME